MLFLAAFVVVGAGVAYVIARSFLPGRLQAGGIAAAFMLATMAELHVVFNYAGVLLIGGVTPVVVAAVVFNLWLLRAWRDRQRS